MGFCYCCSGKTYQLCCGKFIDEANIPETAEELMRSRYSAYAQAKTDYIEKTMRGKAALCFDKAEAALWAKSLKWVGLKVLQVSFLPELDKAYVEFLAFYCIEDRLHTIHEKSEFVRENGCWFYINGELYEIKPQAVNRNSLCPCGSLKKYKRCCKN